MYNDKQLAKHEVIVTLLSVLFMQLFYFVVKLGL